MIDFKTKTNGIKKRKVLEALEKTLGVITPACRMAGIDRSVFYDWLKNDKDFKKKVDEMKEVALDFAESALFKQIESKNPVSTIFYLKTRGKKRGYIEKSMPDVIVNSIQLVSNRIKEASNQLKELEE